MEHGMYGRQDKRSMKGGMKGYGSSNVYGGNGKMKDYYKTVEHMPGGTDLRPEDAPGNKAAKRAS